MGTLFERYKFGYSKEMLYIHVVETAKKYLPILR